MDARGIMRPPRFGDFHRNLTKGHLRPTPLPLCQEVPSGKRRPALNNIKIEEAQGVIKTELIFVFSGVFFVPFTL